MDRPKCGVCGKAGDDHGLFVCMVRDGPEVSRYIEVSLRFSLDRMGAWAILCPACKARIAKTMAREMLFGGLRGFGEK